MVTKKGIALSSFILMALAVIGCLLLITVLAKFLGILTDPNAVEEGIGCRVAIMATASVKSATQGIITGESLLQACKIIEKEIPMRKTYPRTGKQFKTDPVAFRNAVTYDLVEVINNAWWITAEGKRAEYFVNDIFKVFLSEYNCFVPYAVRIKTPSGLKGKNIPGITEAQLYASMNEISRAELKGGSLQGDTRNILTYITLDEKGAGVFVMKDDKTNSAVSQGGNGTIIVFKNDGADAIYGVAVGFADKSGVNKLFDWLFKDKQMTINSGASFIYIAPFDEVKNLCVISN